MNVFISHNKADKAAARLLATALVQQGVSVWYDEWKIRPGDSIIGGIEDGLSNADVFLLLWSSNAQKSNWVGTEVRAYLRRRVDDNTLRIIPVILDDTPLPSLVADYSGFSLKEGISLDEVVLKIVGIRPDREIARILQRQLLDLTEGKMTSIDPLPYLVCPRCGSTALKRQDWIDYQRDDTYMLIKCAECGWQDSTEI